LKAFELDVSAGTETLILATILGAIIPIGLIGWVITTVTARRRKHKP
jgi:fucose permease